MKIYVDDAYLRKEKHRKLIESAVRFFADNHDFPKRVRVLVTVTPFKMLKGEGRETWAEAFKITPRLYHIKLSRKIANKLTKGHRLGFEILFHELQHVQQFLKGDLKVGKHHLYWKGEKMVDVKYSKDPSEIEAWAVGEEYARDFLAVYFCDMMRELRENEKC